MGGQPSIQPVVINLDSTKYYSKSGIKKKCEQTELIHSYIWYFFMKFMYFHVKKCHQNFSLVTLIFFYSDLLAISKTHTQKKIKIKIQTFKHQTTARMEDEECKMQITYIFYELNLLSSKSRNFFFFLRKKKL